VSTLDRIRSRLGSERGFTLTELLLAVSIGMIVMLAAVNLIDASVRASDEVLDRVDGQQKGRQALEQLTQRLRAQVCPDKNTPAIVEGLDNQITFYSEIGSTADAQGNPLFAPEGRRIILAGGVLKEEVWNTLASPLANTFAAAPTFGRVLADAIFQSGGTPLFRYYGFVGNDPALPDLLLTTPLSATDMARVVKIEVTFDSRPGKRAGQVNRFDTTFQNQVFVRTADPTDPEHSPQCE
jgi:prepilin-type N-terminal cleavage/methylation domain-containing protein